MIKAKKEKIRQAFMRMNEDVNHFNIEKLD